MITHESIIGRELNLEPRKVALVLSLLADGATLPFIARYRKELTGGLDEIAIKNIQQRASMLDEIDKRRAYVKSVIEERGEMTETLRSRLDSAFDLTTLEDLYLPYKPKRRTRSDVARECGLEPLAKIIMSQHCVDVESVARKFVRGKVLTTDAAFSGASDIIAEWISESTKARSMVRRQFMNNAVITSKVVKGKESEGRNYENYYDFSESVKRCSSHRYLAICRGEKEGILKVSIGIDDVEMIDKLTGVFIKRDSSVCCAEIVKSAVKDGYKRLIRPSIESEVASMVKERSDKQAVSMFADNLYQLLMAPPLGHKRVMAIDPGFRTGCKVVCVDEQGILLAHDVIYPCAPVNDTNGASRKVLGLIEQYHVDVIGVGNGTAGRETEQFLRKIGLPAHVTVQFVSEQGASVYSVSDVAREEFPDYDVTVRGAVSIARRLLDPLSELVKIEPKSIGVGQYQHDVNQTMLKDALDFTIERCVNSVGVNVNTASKQLLAYVSGIGISLADAVVRYRTENSAFRSRNDLKKVPRLGAKAFQQCAGFLRIPDSDNPLDNSAVHPERYSLVNKMASDMGMEVASLIRNKSKIELINLSQYITDEVGMPTLIDIAKELEKPGRDPRSESDVFSFDDNITHIADLVLGMELDGKVTNVTAFGAFVDIGIKENGLVHISQLADRYVSSVSDVVKVGDHVRVRVIEIDTERKRVALSMKGISYE